MSEHQYPASLTHGLSREEILNRLHNRLDEPRYEHCLRVEATAIELAKRFDQDVDRAGLAGLLKMVSIRTCCNMAAGFGMVLSAFISFKQRSALLISKY